MADLTKLTAPTDAIPEHLGVLIYGAPGSRKSTFSNSAPWPLLPLAFDDGYSRSRWVQRAKYPKTWAEIVELTEDLDGVATVVVDTIGKALDLLTEHVIKLDSKNGYGGSLTPGGWGALGSEFRRWANKVRRSCHIVFVAHEQRGGSNGDKIWPQIAGNMSEATVNNEAALAGWVHPMAVPAGSAPRYAIDFRSTPDRTTGKDTARVGVVEISEDPIQLAELIDKARAEMLKEAQKSKKQSDELTDLRMSVMAANTADELTALAEAMVGAHPQAKRVVRPVLKKRITELGVVWDKEQGKYRLESDPAGEPEAATVAVAVAAEEASFGIGDTPEEAIANMKPVKVEPDPKPEPKKPAPKKVAAKPKPRKKAAPKKAAPKKAAPQGVQGEQGPGSQTPVKDELADGGTKRVKAPEKAAPKETAEKPHPNDEPRPDKKEPGQASFDDDDEAWLAGAFV